VSNIHHPKHYDHPSNVECIDIAERLGFNLGNALKYLWRAGRKGGEHLTKDQAKARFYIKRHIKGVYVPQRESGGLVHLISRVLRHETDSLLGDLLMAMMTDTEAIENAALEALMLKLPEEESSATVQDKP